MTECNKRRYPSVHAARKAVKAMGNSVRAYYCRRCWGYHVTKDRDKSDHGDWGERKRRHDRLTKRMKLERGDDV